MIFLRNLIQEAFEPIQADDTLTQNTLLFLRGQISRRQAKRQVAFRRALAAAAFLFFVGAGGFTLWQVPLSYISIDINPSVELSLNVFERVVAAKAYNDDGEAILEDVRLNGKPYIEAIDTLLTSDSMQGYLTEESLLSYTVASGREQTLLTNIQTYETGRHSSAVYYGTADRSSLTQAHENGLSFGKYHLYEEISQRDPTFTVEKSRRMTMRQQHDLLRSLSQNAEEGSARTDSSVGDGTPGSVYQEEPGQRRRGGESGSASQGGR